LKLVSKLLEKLFSKNKVGVNNYPNLKNWIENELKSTVKGKKILDAGAGELRFKEKCCHLEYLSQDICQYDGKGDGKGLQTEKWDFSGIDIISDIINIPVEDESFDYILCSEVFEHIPDPVKALKEFDRILKKNGEIIITVPFSSKTHFSPYYYYSGFSINFFKYHLKDYEILKANYNGDLGEVCASYTREILGKQESILNKFISFLFLNIIKKTNIQYENDICHGLQLRLKKCAV